jgi:hypothetical protein
MLFCTQTKSQDTIWIVELGVSYDQRFLNQFQSISEAESFIRYTLIDGVNCLYYGLPTNNKLIFQTEVLKYVSVDQQINTNQRRLYATRYWYNQQDLCNKVDLAVHLTTDLDGNDGQASGGACRITPNGGVIIAEAVPTELNKSIQIVAHEIGHLLSMVHETSAFCDIFKGLMCGVSSYDCQEYTLSNDNISNLRNKLKTSTCFNKQNVNIVNPNCPNCSPNIVITSVDQKDYYLNFGCDPSTEEFTLEATISNSCEIDRNYKLAISYHSDFIEIVEKEPEMQDVPTSGNVNFNREIILDWIHLKKGAGAINMVKVRPKNSGYIVDNAQLGYPNLASVSFTYMYNPPGPVIDIAQPINPAPVLSQSQVFYRFFYNHQIDKSNQSFTKASELTNPNTVDINNFCLGTKFDIYLDGIFEVDIDKEFCNTNFYFTPDSRLIIRDGKRLTLTNSSLNSCDAKWDGVIIEGSGALWMNNSKIINAKTGIFSDSEKATVSVKDGCIFENNHTGMELRRSKLVSLTNSTFKDGHKGIVLESCPPVFALDCTFSQLTYGIESNHTSLWVSGGNFTGKSTANGSRAINQIGTGNYLSLKNKTFFTNWHLGVVTSRSSLDIDDCTFENNQIASAIGVTSGLTHYIYKTTFKHGQRGVLSSLNSTFNDFSRIQKCTFDGFDYAVSIGNQTGNKGWLIYDNEITNVRLRGIRLTSSVFNRIEDNPIISADGRSNPKLITLEGSPANIVSNNILDNLSSAPESNQITGIYVAESMGNLIQCNTVNGGSFGINVWGTSNGNYNRNNMISYHTGLYCGLHPSNGISLMGQQMHRFNVWNNGSFNTAAKHLSGDIFFVNESQFTVDPSQNSQYRPDPISSVSNEWFFNQNVNFIPVPCPPLSGSNSTSDFTGPLLNEDNFDQSLIVSFMAGDVNFGPNSALINYNVDSRIYKLKSLSGADSLFKNVYLSQAFTIQHKNGNIGKLHEAAGLIHSSRYADTILTQAMTNLKSLCTTYTEELPLLSEVQQLSQFNIIAQADSALIAEYQRIRNLHLQDLENALDILDNISDTLTPVFNHIVVLRAITSLYKNDSFSVGDWQTVTNVAQQCPLTGGEAVFMARGLIEYSTGLIDYDDHDLCNFTEIRSSKTFEKIKIFPNPSTGIFTIQADKPILSVALYDLQGSLKVIQTVQSGKTCTLDASSLLPGMYFIAIRYIGTDKTEMSKVIKID